jgi:hypothetical protein
VKQLKRLTQNRRYFYVSLLILIIGAATGGFYFASNQLALSPQVMPYIGTAFCGSTVEEAKLMIDRVKTYTNLFVLDTGSSSISWNKTAVYEICDYATTCGLSVIVNVGTYNQSSWFWNASSYNARVQKLNATNQELVGRWGDKFLGIYYNDEPGGIQLDWDWDSWFANSTRILNSTRFPEMVDLKTIYQNMLEANSTGVTSQDYSLETKYFVQDNLQNDPGLKPLNAVGIRTFTSDYALYWFDYLGGYDVMWTQLGWNASVTEQIDLVKGAARMQNKEWGAIVTWTFDQAPYLDSGNQIYGQMLTAYEAGAKYIVIFNYPILQGNDYGVMNSDHFMALQRLWNDIKSQHDTQPIPDLSAPNAVLVLPHDYGWGMRRPDDVIWGFWGPDNKTLTIAEITGTLLNQYGTQLDIIYDDPAYPLSQVNYQKVYYWNSTTQLG